jgi:peptide chain release factor 2
MDSDKINELKNRIDLIVRKKDKEKLLEEQNELESKVQENGFWNDNESAQKVMKNLSGVKAEIDELNSLLSSIESIDSLSKDADDETSIGIIDDELQKLEKKVNEVELDTFLSGKFDKSDAILKIVAGQGGTEASDWAEMVFRMYLRYCNSKGWTVNVIDELRGTEAGIDSITFQVSGRYVYGYLKREHGTHRLVRNSPFNAQGLRQTSFAGVEVMPIVDEDIDIDINENDLEFSAVRSSGAGGQNVNKVASKVRIVHKPTGISVESSAQRSQSQNRETAMKMLKAKLYEIEEEKQIK